MRIEVDITKKRFFILLISLFVICGGIFAYAYSASGSGGTPSVFGHSIDEIDWNQIIPFVKAGHINATSVNTTKICISGDCKTNWPSSGSGTTAVTCPAGQAVQTISSTGTVTCIQVQTITPTYCYTSDKQFTPGATCTTGSSSNCNMGAGTKYIYQKTCQNTGSWSDGPTVSTSCTATSTIPSC